MKRLLKALLLFNIILPSIVISADDLDFSDEKLEVSEISNNKTDISDKDVIISKENNSLLNKIKNNKGKMLAALGFIGSVISALYRGYTLDERYRSIKERLPFLKIIFKPINTYDQCCDICKLSANEIKSQLTSNVDSLLKRSNGEEYVILARSRCCNYNNIVCMECYRENLRITQDIKCPIDGKEYPRDSKEFIRSLFKVSTDHRAKEKFIKIENYSKWKKIDEVWDIDNFDKEVLKREASFKQNLNFVDKYMFQGYKKVIQYKKEIGVSLGIISVASFIYYLYKKGCFESKPGEMYDEFLDQDLDLQELNDIENDFDEDIDL